MRVPSSRDGVAAGVVAGAASAAEVVPYPPRCADPGVAVSRGYGVAVAVGDGGVSTKGNSNGSNNRNSNGQERPARAALVFRSNGQDAAGNGKRNTKQL